MIVSEVQPIGNFVGASISEPLLQGGILPSALAYILTSTAGPRPVARPMIQTRPARAAATIRFPVALKIRSRDITHKTDVGGVALEPGNAVRVPSGGRLRCSNALGAACPEARLDGFLV